MNQGIKPREKTKRVGQGRPQELPKTQIVTVLSSSKTIPNDTDSNFKDWTKRQNTDGIIWRKRWVGANAKILPTT